MKNSALILVQEDRMISALPQLRGRWNPFLSFCRHENSSRNLLRYMDGKVAAEDQIKKLLADPQLMSALSERAAQKGEAASAEGDKSGKPADDKKA